MRGKEKRTWKRCISAMFALVMLFALPEGVSAYNKDEVKVEWNYEDSLLVDVIVDEPKSFAPEDFPGVDCKKVFMLEKETSDKGILYQLVLVFNGWGEEKLNDVTKKISQMSMVVNVERNYENVNPIPALKLSRSYAYVPVGESKKIDVKLLNMNQGLCYEILGIEFKADPKYFDSDVLDKNSFAELGISHFWPTENQRGYLIMLPMYRDKDLEGKKSETGYYYGLAGEENERLFEAMNALGEEPGILEAAVFKDMYVGGSKSKYETWIMEDPEIAGCELSKGEENVEGIEQTATITGKKPGVTKFTYKSDNGDFTADTCTVIVYEPGGKNNPGDLDHSGSITAEDALQILKQSVGLISLDEDSKKTADLNLDGKVNAEDALLMLKIAVGNL